MQNYWLLLHSMMTIIIAGLSSFSKFSEPVQELKHRREIRPGRISHRCFYSVNPPKGLHWGALNLRVSMPLSARQTAEGEVLRSGMVQEGRLDHVQHLFAFERIRRY